MPTIVHFEIPSDNIERSKKFYSELFGWNIEKVPADQLPEGADAWRIYTQDHKGSNGVNGGIHKRMSPEQQGITNFVDVKSVDEYSDKVKQFGGGAVQVQKWLFQRWVIWLYAQTQRTIHSDYGRVIPQQSNNFRLHTL